MTDTEMVDFLAENLGNDLIFVEEEDWPNADNPDKGWYWGPIATDQWYEIEQAERRGPFPTFREAVRNAKENFRMEEIGD